MVVLYFPPNDPLQSYSYMQVFELVSPMLIFSHPVLIARGILTYLSYKSVFIADKMKHNYLIN